MGRRPHVASFPECTEYQTCLFVICTPLKVTCKRLILLMGGPPCFKHEVLKEKSTYHLSLKKSLSPHVFVLFLFLFFCLFVGFCWFVLFCFFW